MLFSVMAAARWGHSRGGAKRPTRSAGQTAVRQFPAQTAKASVAVTTREAGASCRGGCGQVPTSVSLVANRPPPSFLRGRSAACTALQRSDRGQAAASTGSPPAHASPSVRLPMTACFFRKSLHSFLLRPKASMLWVNVLEAHGGDVKLANREGTQHASSMLAATAAR